MNTTRNNKILWILWVFLTLLLAIFVYVLNVSPHNTYAAGSLETPQAISPARWDTERMNNNIPFVFREVDGATGYDFFLYNRETRTVVNRLSNQLASSICNTNGICTITSTVALPDYANHYWRLQARNSEWRSPAIVTYFRVVTEVLENPQSLSPLQWDTRTPDENIYRWQATEWATSYRIIIRDRITKENEVEVLQSTDVCNWSTCSYTSTQQLSEWTNHLFFLQASNEASFVTSNVYTYFNVEEEEVVIVDPPAPICGNNTLEPAWWEQCDDGNTTSGDGCNNVCQNEVSSGWAQIIFQDNFDNTPNFSVGENQRCASRLNQACVDNPAPVWWDFYYTSERFHPDNLWAGFYPSLQINNEQPRWWTGKSMIIRDESYWSPSQWWSDAVLSKEFSQDYKDIYAEIWIKYDPNWEWASQQDFGQSIAKLMRLSKWTFEDGDGRFSFFGWSQRPLIIMDMMDWKYRWSDWSQARFTTAFRCAPEWTNRDCWWTTWYNQVPFPWVPTFKDSAWDGNWHKYAFRIKMNSAPWVADGIYQQWYDDTIVMDKEGIMWVDENGDEDVWLNLFSIWWNMHNYPYPEEDQFEQWWAIDDVKVYDGLPEYLQ